MWPFKKKQEIRPIDGHTRLAITFMSTNIQSARLDLAKDMVEPDLKHMEHAIESTAKLLGTQQSFRYAATAVEDLSGELEYVLRKYFLFFMVDVHLVEGHYNITIDWKQSRVFNRKTPSSGRIPR